jgi:predicted nucleotidyltransferase
MRRISDEDIARLVAEIVSEVAPEAIYLFGSRARGEAREDSDIDLLVVEREPFGEGRSRRRELARLWHLVAKHRLPVDVLLYSRDEVEDWRATPGHVIARALDEGRALYAA